MGPALLYYLPNNKLYEIPIIVIQQACIIWPMKCH